MASEMRTPYERRTYVNRTRLDLDTTTAARTISPSGPARRQGTSESGEAGKERNPLLLQSQPDDATSKRVASTDHRGPKRDQPKTRRPCVGCRVPGYGIVFGLEVCERCGKRVNAAIASEPWYPGPCVGEVFKQTQRTLRIFLKWCGPEPRKLASMLSVYGRAAKVARKSCACGSGCARNSGCRSEPAPVELPFRVQR